MTTGFLYLQLSEQQGKPVEILRTGTFTDRNGQKVEVTTDDLDAYVANFKAGAAGQDVPIDVDHDRREAGGWFTRIWREGDRLLGEVDWNELGQKLVGDKIYRYLSATIDLAAKVIKSVSLVNFPAVKGLKPVELSDGAMTFAPESRFSRWINFFNRGDDEAGLMEGERLQITISDFLQAILHKVFTDRADTLALTGHITADERKQMSTAIGEALTVFADNAGDAGSRTIPAPSYYPEMMFSQSKQSPQPTQEDVMDEKQLAELREKIRKEEAEKVAAELAQKQQQETELREQIRKEEREKAEVELREQYERRRGFTEFADEICNGEAALSAKPEQVIELLEALPNQEAIDKAKALLKAKVVSFTERGSSRNGKVGLKELPEAARKDVIDGTFTLKELFDSHVLPGQPAEYDLSEFNATQKGF